MKARNNPWQAFDAISAAAGHKNDRYAPPQFSDNTQKWSDCWCWKLGDKKMTRLTNQQLAIRVLKRKRSGVKIQQIW